jgi:hypothetical protein
MGIETSHADFIDFVEQSPAHLNALHAALGAEDEDINALLKRMDVPLVPRRAPTLNRAQPKGDTPKTKLEEVLKRGEANMDLFDEENLIAEKEEGLQLEVEEDLGVTTVKGDIFSIHNTATQWLKGTSGGDMSASELEEISEIFYEYPSSMSTRDARIVYLVLSVPGEITARKAIRETWGKGQAVYFLVAHTQHRRRALASNQESGISEKLYRGKDYTNEIAQEQAKFEDLIVIAMAEGYRVAVYKMLAGVHAVEHHAKEGWKYLVKVNIFNSFQYSYDFTLRFDILNIF